MDSKRFTATGTGLILICCLATICQTIHALETRGNPASIGGVGLKPQNGTASARLQKGPAGLVCGNSNDLAKRVEVCAKPLMDLLQGTIEKWPRTNEDAMELCSSFQAAERCIRESSRKCGKGIQKTIISTLAHSIARARKRECSRAKAPAIVKTTMCLEKNQNIIQDWMSNVTGRLSAVELQTQGGDKKVNAVCCMVNDIDFEIKQMLNPLCPSEGELVSRLYRAILEDVVEIVCRNPKCNNYLKGYKITKYPDFGALISILLRIVFSLDSN